MTTVERTELLVPEPARALGALLDVEVPDLENGSELPLLWHWIYLLERPATADLGEDGHPVRGSVPAPPGAGRRRMIAGGRVRRVGPLRCGEPATRRSRVESSTEKVGRSGPLTIVTLRHEISQRGGVVIDERQDIVYRDAARRGAQVPGPPESPTEVAPGAWQIDTSPTLLFRFSALTYNAHRIHYDRTYAQEVEGYPGLVVHGPLQAVAMAEASRAEGRAPIDLEYRFEAPVFDEDGLVVESGPVDDDGSRETWTRTRSGRRAGTGRLRTRA